MTVGKLLILKGRGRDQSRGHILQEGEVKGSTTCIMTMTS